PFADPSALPMVVLCQHVAKRVKVALCGDGGDEVCCGYPWHWALDRLDRWNHRMPAFVRRFSPVLGNWLSPQMRFQAHAFAQTDRVSQWAMIRTGFTDSAARALPVEGAESREPFVEYYRQWAK